MLSKEKIERINDLARKQKSGELTREEKNEQSRLRAEYLESFRKSFRQQLENVHFVEDMTEEELLLFREEKIEIKE